MNQQHIDLAGRAILRGHRGQPLEQRDLVQRQPLKAGHEHGLRGGAYSLPLAGRRARLTDRGLHLPPEVELPLIPRPEMPCLATARGVCLRAQFGLTPLPLQDHARPAEVVVVEAVGDPAGGQQRPAGSLDDLLEGRSIPRQHLQDREREVIDVPRICVGPRVCRDQRRDRSRIREIHVCDDAVAQGLAVGPPARPQPLRQLGRQPGLRSRGRHDDPLPREEIDRPGEERHGRFDHVVERADIADGERHGADLSE